MTSTRISTSKIPWDAVGNGAVLAAVGPDALRLGSYGEVFCHAVWDEGGTDHACRWQGDALAVAFYGERPPADPTLHRSAVTVRMYCDAEEPVLAMGVVASHDMSWRICPADGVRLIYIDRLSSAFDGIPCLKMIAASGKRLYVVFDGNVAFDSEAATFRFALGKSRLILILTDGERENETARLERLYRVLLPEAGLRFLPRDRMYRRSALRRREAFSGGKRLWGVEHEEMRHRLHVIQSREGGFWLADSCQPLREQGRLLDFLIADDDRRQAEAYVAFLDRLTQRWG